MSDPPFPYTEVPPHCILFHDAEDDEDHESVHEGLEHLAGSSATKKTRARQLLRSPAKRVSCNLLYAFNWQITQKYS